MQRFLENAKARLNNEPIMLLANLIEWRQIEACMQTEYWREVFKNGGRNPYDYRCMMRALLLARWYCLSYQKLERALRIRLDFILFCGFSAEGRLPDACTLNRFKKRLSTNGALDEMAAEVDRQLLAQGLRLRQGAEALDDPLLVKVPLKATWCM